MYQTLYFQKNLYTQTREHSYDFFEIQKLKKFSLNVFKKQQNKNLNKFIIKRK